MPFKTILKLEPNSVSLRFSPTASCKRIPLSLKQNTYAPSHFHEITLTWSEGHEMVLLRYPRLCH